LEKRGTVAATAIPAEEVKEGSVSQRPALKALLWKARKPGEEKPQGKEGFLVLSGYLRRVNLM